MSARTAESIRADLGHPVIDADGHILEFMPAVLPFLRESLGSALFETYRSGMMPIDQTNTAPAAAVRARTREPVGTWWGTPAANTRDLATATIPRLMYERLPELGIDYAVLYPTNAVGSAGIDATDIRVGVCRGFNEYYAAEYGPFKDRLTVGAIIPMHHPNEAVEALEHAASLGFKVAVLPEGVWRPIDEPGTSTNAWLAPKQAFWFDTFALDSVYDYDPVWTRAEELEMSLTCHSNVGRPAPFIRTSISNMSFNHLGSHEYRLRPILKSLFFGGVTRRFSGIKFAFLECGIGWVPGVFNSIVELWERRNLDALMSTLDPRLIDFELFAQLMSLYAPGWVEALEPDMPELLRRHPRPGTPPESMDDWRELAVASSADFLDLFVDRFYFGCEADDATVPLAFAAANKLGATFKPLFGSDVGHWDVSDMAGVVPEAHTFVERQLLSPDQFEQFVCRNAMEFFSASRPTFFDGTVVDRAGARPGV